jgi:hypothetical protein
VKLPRCAIPLYVTKSERITLIGTGFLARRKGEVGLVTAANVPIGIRPFATGGWVGWPHEILAVTDPTGSPQPVHLFQPEESVRAPVFSYRLRNEATGYLHDMLGFFDPIHEPAISALQDVYEVIDLDEEASEPHQGAVVTALGYPDRGGSTMWPYGSPRRTSGAVAQVTDDGLIEAALGAAGGFHGGPVFTDKGGFVGMVSEGDGRSGRIHPRAALLEL